MLTKRDTETYRPKWWTRTLKIETSIIYPPSVMDAKRMIDNYVPKFVPNNSNKEKGKKQDEDKESIEEEELFFLQQQDKNWQYCGWCKKKHPVVFDDCVRVNESGITQVTTTTNTNTNTNETKQQEDQADGKQQAEGYEQEANFFMQAFEEDYESDEDEYSIVCCTQSSVTVDYKRICDRTAIFSNRIIKWSKIHGSYWTIVPPSTLFATHIS